MAQQVKHKSHWTPPFQILVMIFYINVIFEENHANIHTNYAKYMEISRDGILRRFMKEKTGDVAPRHQQGHRTMYSKTEHLALMLNYYAIYIFLDSQEPTG